MKVGDLVKLLRFGGNAYTHWTADVALVVGTDPSGWLIVVNRDGYKQMWPPTQMELVEKR